MDFNLAYKGIWAYRLYGLPGDEAVNGNSGIHLSPGDIKKVTIEVYDVSHQSAHIDFYLKAALVLTKAIPYDTTRLKPAGEKKDSIWTGPNKTIRFPVNTSYINTYPAVNMYNNQVNVTDAYPVLQKPYRVAMYNTGLTDTLKSKTVMHAGNTYVPVIWHGDTAIAFTNALGYVYPEQDNQAPVIQMIYPADSALIQWRMWDNMSGIKNYTIYIDSTWQPCYYDAKTATASCRPCGLKGSAHHIHITAADNTGNESNLELDIPANPYHRINKKTYHAPIRRRK
jgi:hypothetical protein